MNVSAGLGGPGKSLLRSVFKPNENSPISADLGDSRYHLVTTPAAFGRISTDNAGWPSGDMPAARKGERRRQQFSSCGGPAFEPLLLDVAISPIVNDDAALSASFGGEDMRNAWERAPAEVKYSIEQAVIHGTPALSVAFYSRWWQLETWLRQLVYLEFRAKWGRDWANHLVPQRLRKTRRATAEDRAGGDVANQYMATPDTSNVMSYLDVGVLFELIRESWPLFEKSLLPQKRWEGWVEEVQQVRHRSAHCRRPHADDLSRIELLLRDLESGAWNALTAHNLDSQLDRIDPSDPVVAGWVLRQHPAAHLVDHASRAHRVELQLTWSKRPWATYKQGETITGREGFFIHAAFHLLDAYVLPLALWDQFKNPRNGIQKGLVYLLATSPHTPRFTLAASDGGEFVNAAIADAFEGVLMAKRGGDLPRHWLDRWRSQSALLDHRVLVDSPLDLAHPDTPFPVFSAR